MRSVANGITYFVERDFDKKYTQDWRDLMRVEQMVEQWHVQRLRENCETEKVKQKRMIYRARNTADGDAREEALQKAIAMKMPSCEELRSIKSRS